MGQNYSSVAVADGNARAGIDIPELADISYEKSLGSARFLKTIRAKHADGLVVVKIFAKPPQSSQLDRHRERITRDQEALEGVVNAFPYERVVETDRAAYLVRQYLYSSLYDRISTRPFLEEIEKKWIAFQLLCGLRDCHARGVHHGDIKAENVLVTSWNWIYLSDFAPFKPTYLPADNPADFSYFFDTSLRRICYVAPERFLDAGQKRAEDAPLTDEMDIFSLGCVIAELFLEGTPLFTLSQLFKYRAGGYDPSPYLAKIEDKDIRELVKHMISLDWTHRYSAEKYLEEWRRKAFPEYFYSFLHQYIGFVTDPTAGRNTAETDNDHYGRSDDRIDRLYHDFDKISFFLGYDTNNDPNHKASSGSMFPVHLDIPNYQRNSSAVRRRNVTSDDGTLIFLSLVASSIRNTSRTGSRVRGCDLMLAFSERITDEAKMDRCLPYLVALLSDESIIVQVSVIRTLTQLMELVEVASPTNSHVFPDYILPKIAQFATSESPLVRATYASCLASLANSASRFLDMTQALRADGALPMTDPEAEPGSDMASAQVLFDTSKNTLIIFFQDHAKALLTDSDPAVRRAFLRSVSRLCVFFGQNKANDIILSHLNTYLNDQNWILRAAFFETITGIATYLGSVALEEYIMPLMVQSLTDPEEFVVEKVLRAIASMTELGLYQRSKIWELVDIIGRFTMHPNIWIRQSAIGCIVASTKWLAPADIYCIIYPLVQPYLKTKLVEISPINLLENVKKPLSRTVFDMAVTWATSTREGLFWASAQGQRLFASGFSTNFVPRLLPNRDLLTKGSIRQSNTKNSEDEAWLAKMRNLGMTAEDEWKIVALREYIWRMAKSRNRLSSDSTHSILAGVISLKNLDITPQTIFFDENESFFHLPTNGSRDLTRAATIADALMDASRTIDNPLRRTSSKLQLRTTAAQQYRNVEPGSASDSGSATPIPSSLHMDATRNSMNSQQTSNPNITGSESLLSPTSSKSGSALRHSPSKASLLNRREPSKALAETSTVPETAFGMLEPPLPKDFSRGFIPTPEEPQHLFRAAHSYDGNDPHILNLLDTMYLQNYPSDIVEFGPTIVPVNNRTPIKKSSGRNNGGPWRPECTFVASFGEHSEAINRVVCAPDHNFFVTASDDGTVKIWDSTRLEKNVAFRARQTYKHGNKVKALCFIENTRCFASAAVDGSIHVVKVDFQTTAAKYGKLKVMREYQLPNPNEYAVWMEHFKSESNSILLIATNISNIHALDLRTMKILYTLKNPVHHGTPTCFCLDRRHNWLILGTSHGILELWDLRFQLRIKSWGLPGSTPIHRLQTHPSKSRQKWILVAGGTGSGELTLWDIEKSLCREVYRSGSHSTSSMTSSYEPWYPDDETPEAILARFGKSCNPMEPAGATVDRGVRAFVACQDSEQEGATMGFVITAAADRKIRFWNTARIEGSCVVNGMVKEDEVDGRAVYMANQITAGLTVYTETVKAADTESVVSSTSAGGAGGIRSFLTGHSGAASMQSSPSQRGRKKEGRNNRSTVISQQQQMLLKTHLEAVMDVTFLEVPYGMVVSVDRGGMVVIYQ